MLSTDKQVRRCLTHYHLGGTIRARAPSETLSIIQPYIQRAGITRIANLTHLDSIGVPVYTCFRPASRNLSTSQGKGITDDLAKCSAYMEGIEQYYAEQLKPLLTNTLPGKDPAFLPLRMLPKGLLRYTRPSKKMMSWSPSQSLISGHICYVPTYYFNFDLSMPQIENGMFRKSTTGLASGNTKTEALCHAFYEIIERHSTQRFEKMSYASKLKRMVSLKTIDDPYARDLLQKLYAQEIDVVVFELDSAFKVPTYHCIIADENPFRQLGHYSGSGSHLNKGIALCRAITEAIQSRLTYIAGSRDDLFPAEYRTEYQPLKFTGHRDYQKLMDIPDSTLEQQYQCLLQKMESLHYDALMIEHTTATDLISVVHVLIPGLAI